MDENVPVDADLISCLPAGASLRKSAASLQAAQWPNDGVDRSGRRHGIDELFYDWGVLADDMMVEDVGPDFRAQGGV